MPAVKRPMAVTIMAIVNFVIGGLGLVGVIAGVATNFGALGTAPAAAVKPGTANPADPFATANELTSYIIQHVPNYKSFLIAGIIVGLLRAVLLIGSGIGLLGMKPYGRMLAFVYIVIALIGTTADAAFSFTQVIPATEQWEKERNEAIKASGRTPPPSMTAITSTVGGGMGVACGLAYPIILLVIMLLPSVRDAFAGRAAPSAEPEDELDADRPLRGSADPNERREDDGPETGFRARPSQ
jgi:hypothetical protein